MDSFLTAEQRELLDVVRRFARSEIEPRAAEIDRSDRFPRALYTQLAELGLFGICLAPEAGGSGLDTPTACLVMEEIARASGSMGNAYAIPMEAVTFLQEHGGEVHRRLIPDILSGKIVSATAATEADYGSDVAGLRTMAVRDGDEYVISGTKAWVTFGAVADVFVVFARTRPEGGHRGISCILVEGDRPGLHRGKHEDLMGMHGLEDCALAFDEVRVPVTNRIGPEHEAFKMAMGNFNFSRLMVSSMALGMAQAAFDDAVAYAGARKQFGAPINSFQAVQFMLADMSTDISAARLLIHHAGRLFDAGHSIAKEAAQAKLFTTDMANRAASSAVQIHGGNGYSKHYRVERIYRDVRLSQIYEGTNQIQRLIIARQIEKEARAVNA
ncbi:MULTISPECIES: acyl-CoA dehydrogenase family protein [Xanthobacter]|uniref:acyl-CoA dehydrogenase family protein n=1 Tax=Xanthobacter TaxID=279 RepID=UPI000496E4D6|nr:acyl-CoA dehydrogenase family protein [Xanthobacter sp. 91]